jgi:hypothetical protein
VSCGGVGAPDTLQVCQLHVAPFTHSAVVWQAWADASVDDGAGRHLLPCDATFWHAVPAVAVFSFATAQQTSPLLQSVAWTHPNEALPVGHVEVLAMQDTCSVSLRQQMCVLRSHGIDPQSASPAELNWMFDGTRPASAVPEPDELPEPDLPPELELLVEPPELDDPPELDPPSPSSSPERPPLLLLLHPSAPPTATTARASDPSTRTQGLRRAAIRRDVM